MKKHESEQLNGRQFGTLAIFTLLWVTLAQFAVGEHANADTTRFNRIVAIGGSVTEIIYALGEQDRLIGRDTTSVFPKEAFSLPDVGYIRRLSPEGVLSVNPDLIIALEGSGPPEAIEALEAANIAVRWVPEGYTGEKIAEKINTVGAILGVEAKARALAEETTSAVLEASNSGSPVETKPKVLFILSMQGGKIMAAGKDTGADGIIALAGGHNIMDSYSGYKQVSDEAIITAEPDIILAMTPRGNHSFTDEQMLAHPAIASSAAGKNQRIIRMDGMYMLGFGPRTADAVKDLNKAITDAYQQ